MHALTVQRLGKAYKRYPRKAGRLLEWLGLGTHHQLRWVLQDIDLAIAPGEAVGLIGANGAGKSTLLKIITGTVRPTVGAVHSHGRIAALLELGIGFHGDFTGRQNIHLSGQLAGLSRDEITARIADIAAFADLGDYLDQPVRTYSSGMHVRLAFAIATAVRPDILIVDEALAVGDVVFQQKCFERIRAFRDAGTTLLFVSHAMSTVYALCDRAVLLDGGRILCDGPPRAAIDLYNALAAQRLSSTARPIVQQPGGATGSYGDDSARVQSVELLVDGAPVTTLVGDVLATVRVEVAFAAAFADPHVGFQIRNRRGEAVYMTHTHAQRQPIGPVAPGTRLAVDFTFPVLLAPGDYTLTAGIADGGLPDGAVRDSIARSHDVHAFTVTRNPYAPAWDGLVNLSPDCAIRRS